MFLGNFPCCVVSAWDTVHFVSYGTPFLFFLFMCCPVLKLSFLQSITRSPELWKGTSLLSSRGGFWSFRFVCVCVGIYTYTCVFTFENTHTVPCCSIALSELKMVTLQWKAREIFTEALYISISFHFVLTQNITLIKNNKIVKVWYDMDRLKRRLKSYEINYSSDQCQRVMCPWMEWLLKVSGSSHGESNRLVWSGSLAWLICSCPNKSIMC